MALAAAAEQMFGQDFAGRCRMLARAAENYALTVADRTRQGKPISTQDAQTAAIALAGGFILATRNTRDLEGIEGLSLADPWKSVPIF